MNDYLTRSVRLKTHVASLLEMKELQVDDHVVTTPERVAGALADLVFIRRPTTPQAIEMLCEIVLIVQDLSSMDPNVHHRDLVGGTAETGWPINPRERLTDCVIAAADLGMFDPVPQLTPAQQASHGRPTQQTGPPWPINEQLPDGFDQEFAPHGGHWIATRKFAYLRLESLQSGPPRSAYAQFLWELDQLIEIIVNVLMDVLTNP